MSFLKKDRTNFIFNFFQFFFRNQKFIYNGRNNTKQTCFHQPCDEEEGRRRRQQDQQDGDARGRQTGGRHQNPGLLLTLVLNLLL